MSVVDMFTHLELIAVVNQEKCELTMTEGTSQSSNKLDLKENKMRKLIESILILC